MRVRGGGCECEEADASARGRMRVRGGGCECEEADASARRRMPTEYAYCHLASKASRFSFTTAALCKRPQRKVSTWCSSYECGAVQGRYLRSPPAAPLPPARTREARAQSCTRGGERLAVRPWPRGRPRSGLRPVVPVAARVVRCTTVTQRASAAVQAAGVTFTSAPSLSLKVVRSTVFEAVGARLLSPVSAVGFGFGLAPLPCATARHAQDVSADSTRHGVGSEGGKRSGWCCRGRRCGH